jgi:hypothetical protein
MAARPFAIIRSHKKIEECEKIVRRYDLVTKQQTEQAILCHTRHVVAASLSRRGISKHDRSLSELCITYAGAEIAPAPPLVDRHVSSVVGCAGAGSTSCERCAA